MSNEKTKTAEEKKETAKVNDKTQEVNPIQQLQQQIEMQIKKFNLLQEKLNHRDTFKTTLTKLETVSKNLNDEELKNAFQSETFGITLGAKKYSHSDRDEEIFRISNVEIIREFLTFISAKINVKILQLEKEIIAAN